MFDGSITAANRSGGFVGWTDGSLSIRDCIFAPCSVSGGNQNGGTFYYNSHSTDTAVIANSCYLTPFGAVQGRQGHTVTGGTDVTVGFGQRTNYSVSGITAYPAGLKYHGRFYAGADDEVRLTLSCSVKPEGWLNTGFTVSAGALTYGDGIWILNMPDENVVIDVLRAPVFGTPDFTLPALNAIEDEAFEGIRASVVFIPDSCTSIGDYAFRDCPVLKQISIPANCTLGTDVFDLCGTVYVYGVPGSSAEDYCASHDNCVFVGVSR